MAWPNDTERPSSQVGLADPRLANDRDHLAASSAHLAEEVHEHVQLSLASHQRGEPALDRDIQASASAAGAHDLEGPQRRVSFGG
jgi:hypothetical protein